MARRDKTNYYLDIAETVLERSTCLRLKYGAIIVRNDEIVSTGYNGAPRGRANCDELGTCVRKSLIFLQDSVMSFADPSMQRQTPSYLQPVSRLSVLRSSSHAEAAELENWSQELQAARCANALSLTQGISQVIVRETKDDYTVYDVADWTRMTIQYLNYKETSHYISNLNSWPSGKVYTLLLYPLAIYIKGKKKKGVNLLKQSTMFHSSEELQEWFKENHSTPGIWIRFKYNPTGDDLTPEDALRIALSYGWVDDRIKKINDDLYRKKFIPRREGSTWVDEHKEIIRDLEARGLMAKPGQDAVAQSRLDGSWDNSANAPVSDAMLEEFSAVLRPYEPAFSNFLRLPPHHSGHMQSTTALPNAQIQRLADWLP